MPYVFNTPADEQAMIQAIGVDNVEQLFERIPAGLRLDRALDLPPAMGELEMSQHIAQLSARNRDAVSCNCFLGGGSYDHFIPAVVDAIASRGEFYTSYTPYQPEVSQGNLQATFEYQTMICQLTGMDVSNASLYDGGSAVAEAALMCLSATRRYGKVLAPDTVHPQYREILATYLENLETELVVVPTTNGVAAVEQFTAALDDQTACVILQSPNFFGCIEDVAAIAQATHQAGAKLVMSFDPISLGLLKRPGELGADIAVAEGQSLGSPLAYGGPYLGIMACRNEFLRRMPGRIAGETVDRRGRRCWVLTLQTREQHIRREKATSNICTNQGLFALRASIYLATVGPQGLRETSELCLHKSHYAQQLLIKETRFQTPWQQPFFKEFVVRDRQGDVPGLLREAEQQGILAGVPLAPWYPELQDCFLVAVTEQRTRSQIEALATCLSSATRQEATLHA